jgi:hypothetical protein
LRPRDEAARGNWEDYPSCPGMVYLTSAYAPYFAMMACEEGDKAVLLEIDTEHLEPELFYPDEDFIAQCLAHQEYRALKEVHGEVVEMIEAYRHHAADSVVAMGNCSYRGTVPPSAITRYCVADPTLQADLFWIGLDPCISPLNYRFCGEKYRTIIAWLFGDREDFVVGYGEEMQSAMLDMNPEYGAHLRKLWGNREGIAVHTPPKDIT